MTKALAGYSAAGALFLVVFGGVLDRFAGLSSTEVWGLAGGIYVIQLAAFGALLALRRRPRAFLASWIGGTLLRLGMLAAVAVWVVRAELNDAAAAWLLIGLAGYLFLLLILEPLFFRMSPADER